MAHPSSSCSSSSINNTKRNFLRLDHFVLLWVTLFSTLSSSGGGSIVIVDAFSVQFRSGVPQDVAPIASKMSERKISSSVVQVDTIRYQDLCVAVDLDTGKRIGWAQIRPVVAGSSNNRRRSNNNNYDATTTTRATTTRMANQNYWNNNEQQFPRPSQREMLSSRSSNTLNWKDAELVNQQQQQENNNDRTFSTSRFWEDSYSIPSNTKRRKGKYNYKVNLFSCLNEDEYEEERNKKNNINSWFVFSVGKDDESLRRSGISSSFSNGVRSTGTSSSSSNGGGSVGGGYVPFGQYPSTRRYDTRLKATSSYSSNNNNNNYGSGPPPFRRPGGNTYPTSSASGGYNSNNGVPSGGGGGGGAAYSNQQQQQQQGRSSYELVNDQSTTVEASGTKVWNSLRGTQEYRAAERAIKDRTYPTSSSGGYSNGVQSGGGGAAYSNQQQQRQGRSSYELVNDQSTIEASGTKVWNSLRGTQEYRAAERAIKDRWDQQQQRGGSSSSSSSSSTYSNPHQDHLGRSNSNSNNSIRSNNNFGSSSSSSTLSMEEWETLEQESFWDAVKHTVEYRKLKEDIEKRIDWDQIPSILGGRKGLPEDPIEKLDKELLKEMEAEKVATASSPYYAITPEARLRKERLNRLVQEAQRIEEKRYKVRLLEEARRQEEKRIKQVVWEHLVKGFKNPKRQSKRDGDSPYQKQQQQQQPVPATVVGREPPTTYRQQQQQQQPPPWPSPSRPSPLGRGPSVYQSPAAQAAKPSENDFLWELTSVYVSEEYQGRGLETELIRSTLQQHFSRWSEDVYVLTSHPDWFRDNFGFSRLAGMDIPRLMASELRSTSTLSSNLYCCVLRGHQGIRGGGAGRSSSSGNTNQAFPPRRPAGNTVW